MANTYLSKSVSTLGSRRKWVYSTWIKRSKITDTQSFLMGYEDSNNYTKCQFDGSDRIQFSNVYGGSTTGQKTTTAQYRDVNAWYHIYLVWNTSDPATADDRMQIWVNGVRVTSFHSDSNPGATTESAWNANPTTHWIGANDASSTHIFQGYMCQTCSIDGTAPAVTVFGSVDADSGEWKPKADGEIRSAVTFGTNGFLLTYENTSYLGYDYQTSDRSGTTFDYTKNGAGLQSQDNPSNVFNTMNPLNIQSASGTFYGANNEFDYNGDSTWRCIYSCMSNSTGKYYFEMKCGSTSDMFVGVIGTQDWKNANGSAHNTATSYSMKSDGNLYNNNTSKAGGVSYTTNDVIGVALDLTNGAIWFSKNNVWTNSATISEIAAGTTTNAAYTGITTGVGYQYGPCGEGKESANQDFNFGNGYFGTGTAITSAGTNTAGIGLFEYDVPDNFTAWSTKGFNE